MVDFSSLTAWPISPSMVQRPDTFDLEAENFMGHFSTFGSELSNMISELTTFQQEMSALQESAAESASLAADELQNCKGEVVLAAESATAAAVFALTAVNAPGTSATSATSLTIGTGNKSLTIQTGKAFCVGQFVTVAYTAIPGNYMFGQITAHDSGTGGLTVNVIKHEGSGAYATWTIALSPLTVPVETGAIGIINNPSFYWPGNNGAISIGSGSFEVIRDGPANFIKPSGAVQPLGPGVGGYANNKLDLPCASENNILYAKDQLNAAWTVNVNMGITDGISDPDGGTDAFTLTANGTSSVFGQVTAGTIGITQTGSYWIRRRTGTGSIGMVVGDNHIQHLSVTDDWARLDRQNTPTTNIIRLYISISTSGDEVDIFWGQVEPLPFATPPIDTGSSPVSRLGTTARFDREGNLPDSLAPKTVMFDIKVLGSNGVTNDAFGSGDFRMILNNAVDGKNPYVFMDAGSETVTIVAPDEFNFCASYNPNTTTLKMYHRGVLVAQDTSATSVRNAVNFITIGDPNAYMQVGNLRIWPAVLTDEAVRIAAGGV